MNIDGLAVYNGPLAGAAQSSTPSTQDTGIVAFFRLDEQTGIASVDDLHGPGLNLFNFVWLTGGTWLASNRVTITVSGISSTSTIGSVLAVSNAVLVPITGLNSVSTVPVLRELDATVYTPGLGSTRRSAR
jgi:hypothetical protein